MPKDVVPQERLWEIYEKLKTPFKLGPILKLSEEWCDSPTVFRYQKSWYMSYIRINRQTDSSGYESYLAQSDDLIRWKTLFTAFHRSEVPRWDARQIAAYGGFIRHDLKGDFAIQPINGRYYFSTLGGNLDGYETDPLAMGQGFTTDIENAAAYRRFETPVLAPWDADARPGERKTIYKADFFEDERQTLGYRYVSVYNAKDSDNRERVFLAVSENGTSWHRYGSSWVFSHPDAKITGDPVILTDGDLYIMLYFVLPETGGAYNTFAVSTDLVNWTCWQGPPLIQPEFEWENQHAHKPCVVIDQGTVYHFYCGCNTQQERFIALAVSREPPLRERVYAYLRTVPRGKVVTYGQLAAAMGNPRMARAVGNILHTNPDPIGTPCFKVVNSRGNLAEHFGGGGAEVQRYRLEAEEITVTDGRVDLEKYCWKHL